ncbi:hypothetical protein [Yeosuana marina]|uniref:hypothetical protein n=1 Tax=Yeosuana marina TaxID=1565536 RepID=UPI0030C7DC2E
MDNLTIKEGFMWQGLIVFLNQVKKNQLQTLSKKHFSLRVWDVIPMPTTIKG